LQKRFFLKEKKPKFAAFNVLMWIFFFNAVQNDGQETVITRN